MNIRPLTATDEPQWRRLWLDYQNFYHVTLPLEVTQATWQRFFDEGEPIGALGALEGDALLGIVHFVFQHSTWSVERVCYLQDLYVETSARKRGIGRCLIQAVYDIAAAAGIHRTYWLTQDQNRVARALYDDVATCPGFVLYEHRRDPTEHIG